MAENKFSKLIKCEINPLVKTAHSIRDFGNTRFKRSEKKDSALSAYEIMDTANEVVEKSWDIVHAATGAVPINLIDVGKIAITAVGGAGFVAMCAGPQVAIIIAIVGLAVVAKNTYSNREAAHKVLEKFVWNLIDDAPGSNHIQFKNSEDLDAASSAALTLLDDGKNQIKLLGSKFEEAQAKFKTVNLDVEKNYNAVFWLINKKSILDTDISKNLVEIRNIQNQLSRKSGDRDANMLKSKLSGLSEKILNIRKQRGQLTEEIDIKLLNNKLLWNKESRPGGVIFQYIRRCSHTGNYMQAAHIVSLAMQERFSPGSVVGKSQPDFFSEVSFAQNLRAMFTRLDLEYALRIPDFK